MGYTWTADATMSRVKKLDMAVEANPTLAKAKENTVKGL